MNRLSISLLGTPVFLVDGQPIHIRRRKAMALLVYLATHQTKQHRNELAALFWPELPHVSARNNLRRALYSLHRFLGEDTPLVDGDIVELPARAGLWVDVIEVRHLSAHIRQAVGGNSGLTQNQLGELERGVALHQGDFATGLNLPDCPEFDLWQHAQAEGLRADLIWALTALMDGSARLNALESAIEHGRHLLAITHDDESVLQRLMALYVRADQSPSAIQLYQHHVALLAQDLGEQPGQETQRLYHAIRAGALTGKTRMTGDASATVTDNFAQLAKSPLNRGHWGNSPFVAREHALSDLVAYLTSALGGSGQIVFVTGDAGSGKTTLMREFVRRACQEQPALVVAYGACAAHFGDGDPYLPFRELLQGMLTSRELTRSQTIAVVEALLTQGPALIESFIGDFDLDAAITQVESPDDDWRRRMTALLAQRQVSAGERHRLHEQYAAVLETLARQWPLLLVLDDLHWADLASLNLLLYLARHAVDNRILVIGAYRSEEISVHKGGPHPLLAVIEELQRRFGHNQVSLDATAVAEGRHFVDALLDLEPNRLDESFRQALFAHSKGHALFTVELLRQLRQQGDIIRADDGRWGEATVHWAVLPSRVEAVIAQRLHRLPDELSQILVVASVEGETFSAEVVAGVLGIDGRDLIRKLSHALDVHHHLVSGVGVRRVGDQRLSRYQFRHSLFQQYLYQSIDATECQLLHEAVGEALEAIYKPDQYHLATVAPALARHFEEAGLISKAVEYRRLAGQRAVRMSAHREAIRHLERALELVENMSPGADRTELELAVLLELSVPLAAHNGYGHESLAAGYAKAMRLATKAADLDREFRATHGKWRYRMLRGNLTRARELATRLAEIAEITRDGDQEIEAWRALGTAHFHEGNLVEAQGWLERCVAQFDAERHGEHIHVYGHDPSISARGYLAHLLWLQASPQAAVALARATIRDARKLKHPFSLAHALGFNGAHIHQFVGDAASVLELAQECAGIADEYEFPMWSAAAEIFAGWAETSLGRAETGIKRTESGVAQWQEIGSKLSLSYHLGLLADVYRMAKQPELGLATVDEALAAAAQSGEQWWQPELYRLRGDLLRISDAKTSKTRDHYLNAINLAKQIGTVSLALRAESSLGCFMNSIANH